MVKFTDETFGAKLIEAITAGLYDGNLNCLREYVQNSIDSKAKIVDIDFENNEMDLVIRDDGCGMDRQELEKALHLGRSEKTDASIGWRGIGIWSGVPACQRIVIITKKVNHSKYKVEINAEKLRDQYNLDIPAAQVLTEVTSEIEELPLESDESLENSQFTIIRLEYLLPNQRTIYTKKDIREYLSQVVPAPFDTDTFKLGNVINKKLQENGIELVDTKIFFEITPIYRPPNSDDLFFNQIIEKQFFVKKELVAYAWVLTSKNNKVLSKPNRGIYFKKKGVTIGDENLVINQHEGSYNYWHYGEIHIITNKLRENAPRNNFEYNNEIIEPFYKQVGSFIQQLQQQNQYQSDKVVSKNVTKAKKLLDEGKIKEAEEEIGKANKRLERKRSFPTDPVLQEMKKTLDKESDKNITGIKEIKKEIEEKKAVPPRDPIKEKRELFDNYIKTCNPALRKHLTKTTKKGKIEFNIAAMDPIKELLQQKTGLIQNDIHKLSKRAYDWRDISKGASGPLLELSYPYRDRYFGVMIQALQELFINPFKHDRGKTRFEYFETMTEEEKLGTALDYYAALSLIYRLIEKSKRIRDP